ncbi:hypothetical protein PMAYCL1PPCAC_10296 [Pristionchus mayeri]|uniref:Fatty-acid and retinol-binding protein 1 n=1 Tax=Pristionchus mayeri TaxID=1317129 RepID=A0AAN5CCV6_9BILA|nr:hypothetical protein PMAYCL1PPCAC_10296 [Pristionchus mayeri]
MFRLMALLALVAVCALAAPFNSIDEVPAEYKELIPEQAKDFVTGLTDEDKKVLKEVAANYANYKTPQEAIDALKEKSPALAEKAEKLHAFLQEKVNALGPDAKAFVEEVIAEARKIHAAIIAGNKPSLEELKAKALEGFKLYKALSDDAKADLEKHFPITASVFKNEKFQELAKKYIKTDA